MPAKPPARNPSNRMLRQLGWALACGVALVGHWLSPDRLGFVLLLCGAAIFAVSTIRPSLWRLLISWFWPGAGSPPDSPGSPRRRRLRARRHAAA